MQNTDILNNAKVQDFLTRIAASEEIRYECVSDDPELAPRRAYDGDAGLDLAITHDVTLYPGETEYIPSNVRFFMPTGYATIVMPRTSSFKNRVNVIPTLIDSSYQGEASSIITNNNTYPVQLKRGMRLAQAVVVPYFLFNHELTEQGFLPQRGDGKFGSSG